MHSSPPSRTTAACSASWALMPSCWLRPGDPWPPVNGQRSGARPRDPDRTPLRAGPWPGWCTGRNFRASGGWAVIAGSSPYQMISTSRCPRTSSTSSSRETSAGRAGLAVVGGRPCRPRRRTPGPSPRSRGPSGSTSGASRGVRLASAIAASNKSSVLGGSRPLETTCPPRPQRPIAEGGLRRRGPPREHPVDVRAHPPDLPPSPRLRVARPARAGAATQRAIQNNANLLHHNGLCATLSRDLHLDGDRVRCTVPQLIVHGLAVVHLAPDGLPTRA